MQRDYGMMNCARCGVECKKNSAPHRYCDDCRKLVSREYSRNRYHSNEDYRRSVIARSEARVRRLSDEGDEEFRQQRARWNKTQYAKPERREECLERLRIRDSKMGAADQDTLFLTPMIRQDPCSYCGDDGGTVDHIWPVNEDGENHWSNMTGACRSCNSSKQDRTDLLVWMLERKQMRELRREMMSEAKAA